MHVSMEISTSEANVPPERHAPLLSRIEGLAAIGLIFLCLSACIAVPLASYIIAPAAFGFAHVCAELRFVDQTFSGRLPGGLVLVVVTSILLALCARLAGQRGWAPPDATVVFELACGWFMACAAATTMRRHRIAGAAIAAAFVGASVLAPFETLLALAIGHNLTPLLFAAVRAPQKSKRRLLLVLAALLIVLPLLIATGWPGAVLQTAGVFAPEAGLMAAGPLDAHLPSYVPTALLDSEWAVPMFSACVFAQTMHYATVIHLLPRLVSDTPRSGFVRWPRQGSFQIGLGLVAVFSCGLFLADFGAAKKFYALAALAHSWIEIPILIFAFGDVSSQASSRR